MEEFIGLIPAAGRAARLMELSGSKEIVRVYPLRPDRQRHNSAKPVCRHLLDAMRAAGVSKSIIVLRTGKWDIPACLVHEDCADMALSYVIIEGSRGVPWTIDAAYPYLNKSCVAFGFPDILFTQDDLFFKLREKLLSSNSDVVLGVFPTEHGSTVDVVSVTKSGSVSRICLKPRNVTSALSWIAAVWRPTFSSFLHSYVSEIDNVKPKLCELFVGDVLAAAIDNLIVSAIVFPEDRFLDIGTPENLQLVRCVDD